MTIRKFVKDFLYDFGVELEVNVNVRYEVDDLLPVGFSGDYEVGTQYEFKNRVSGWSILKELEKIKPKIEEFQKTNIGSDGNLAGSCHIHLFFKKDFRINENKLMDLLKNTWKFKLRANATLRFPLEYRGPKKSAIRIRDNDFYDVEFRINQELADSYLLAYYTTLVYLSSEYGKDIKMIDIPKWEPMRKMYVECGNIEPNILFLKEAKKNFKKIEPLIIQAQKEILKKEPVEFLNIR